MKSHDSIIDGTKCHMYQLQYTYARVFGTYNQDKACLWLTEEVGELIRAIRREHDIDDISGELGDVLVWIFSLINTLKIDGAKLVENSIMKELNRQQTTYGKMRLDDMEQLTHQS